MGSKWSLRSGPELLFSREINEKAARRGMRSTDRSTCPTLSLVDEIVKSHALVWTIHPFRDNHLGRKEPGLHVSSRVQSMTETHNSFRTVLSVGNSQVGESSLACRRTVRQRQRHSWWSDHWLQTHLYKYCQRFCAEALLAMNAAGDVIQDQGPMRCTACPDSDWQWRAVACSSSTTASLVAAALLSPLVDI
jgi:hypothetical protein